MKRKEQSLSPTLYRSFTPHIVFTTHLSTFSWGPHAFPNTINTTTLSSLIHCKINLKLTAPSTPVSSFSFSLRFFESWHLKHSPSTPSSWLSLRHFSSPSPPLKICLRRRLQDPMPELPDLFQALWP